MDPDHNINTFLFPKFLDPLSRPRNSYRGSNHPPPRLGAWPWGNKPGRMDCFGQGRMEGLGHKTGTNMQAIPRAAEPTLAQSLPVLQQRDFWYRFLGSSCGVREQASPVRR
jgi:hypothetical protein